MQPQVTFPRLDAPIVLAHGLGGFDRIGVGPVTLTTYFRGIPEALESSGNRVLVTRVPPLASVETRAGRLGELIEAAFGDQPVHLIGHSMGGLDSRRLASDPKWRRRILSLTTIGTPHLGSWLADFAKLRVGRVYRLLEKMGVDPRGCLDVTRGEARRFHERNPAPADLPCFCVAGEPAVETVCWPLRRFHAILAELDGPNDGLVFDRVRPCLRHPPARLARGPSPPDELARQRQGPLHRPAAAGALRPGHRASRLAGLR